MQWEGTRGGLAVPGVFQSFFEAVHYEGGHRHQPLN